MKNYRMHSALLGTYRTLLGPSAQSTYADIVSYLSPIICTCSQISQQLRVSGVLTELLILRSLGEG